MSAMSSAIRAAASRRNLSVAAETPKEASAAAAVVLAGRRGGRDPGEDGWRLQWIFLGCPGVGKGTYAGRLLWLLGLPHITTGDLVRDALASQGPLSKEFITKSTKFMIQNELAQKMTYGEEHMGIGQGLRRERSLSQVEGA